MAPLGQAPTRRRWRQRRSDSSTASHEANLAPDRLEAERGVELQRGRVGVVSTGVDDRRVGPVLPQGVQRREARRAGEAAALVVGVGADRLELTDADLIVEPRRAERGEGAVWSLGDEVELRPVRWITTRAGTSDSPRSGRRTDPIGGFPSGRSVSGRARCTKKGPPSRRYPRRSSSAILASSLSSDQTSCSFPTASRSNQSRISAISSSRWGATSSANSAGGVSQPQATTRPSSRQLRAVGAGSRLHQARSPTCASTNGARRRQASWTSPAARAALPPG